MNPIVDLLLTVLVLIMLAGGAVIIWTFAVTLILDLISKRGVNTHE